MTRSDITTAWALLHHLWPDYQLPANDTEAHYRTEVWLDVLGAVPAATVLATIRSLGGSASAPSVRVIGDAAARVLAS